LKEGLEEKEKGVPNLGRVVGSGIEGIIKEGKAWARNNFNISARERFLNWVKRFPREPINHHHFSYKGWNLI